MMAARDLKPRPRPVEVIRAALDAGDVVLARALIGERRCALSNLRRDIGAAVAEHVAAEWAELDALAGSVR